MREAPVELPDCNEQSGASISPVTTMSRGTPSAFAPGDS